MENKARIGGYEVTRFTFTATPRSMHYHGGPMYWGKDFEVPRCQAITARNTQCRNKSTSFVLKDRTPLAHMCCDLHWKKFARGKRLQWWGDW